MNDIKVIKFGGTSLRSTKDRNKVIQILRKEVNKSKLVVVVSAMGRLPEPYATDTLLTMAKHLSAKEKDEIMSCGEIISSHLLCDECVSQNLNSICLNILENGIRTDDNYGNGTVSYVDSNYIYRILKEYDIVIVPGFFGTNKYQNTTSLGRGGSDLSAILIAESLGLKEVTLYSDVEGMYSADPKVIKKAILYDNVNVSQALILASLGVSVIQEKACQLAYDKKIRLILKSTFRNEGQTIVDDKSMYHKFIIVKDDGYYLLNERNLLVKLDFSLTYLQAHHLFIE